MKTFLFAVVAVAVSGCGGSVCDRIDASVTRFFAGKTECAYMDGSTTVTVKKTTGSAMSCNSKVSACTAADQAILDKYVKCVEAAPVCSAGNEKAAGTAMTACAVELITIGSTGVTPKVSAGCYAAIQ